MERVINDLNRQIHDLKRENQNTKVAANFLLYSIVKVLDEQSGDAKFSEALKAQLNNELGKITMGGTSHAKQKINELMQPPVKSMFGNSLSEPFLK
ncbi:hypothetical protein AB7Y53_002612 [Salmonella enterica]|uniref:hypothetical protein n=1 Tax=Salmonella enterica TaxID=28901 RepID=UPI000D56719E|nr:hypothetical protein [Salmonella enterica]EBD3355457.1 hypothetical protein [Salmonella enterica subsp. enterica serovar Kentucky]EBF6817806.1 hypothetical protein [Salmonella enterica subsp. enterica serovar Mbandaka]EBM9948513.1 hypothetical protein [Salmonella enterica subsp. enterica serovar Give]EBP4145339.1 hypothetical protein [Salmonella enterica subsp. enterica]ECI0820363.1 hypothetical protein [Salmonella enterica subsp. enterica serovar Senftenberg]EDT6864939.1 hypothetical prot